MDGQERLVVHPPREQRTTEGPTNASYDTFIALLRTTRKLTYAQRIKLKAAAPFGYNPLELHRNSVPSAEL